MKRIIYSALIILMFTGCKTVKLSSKPSPGISNQQPEIKESKIFIPFSINLEEVEKEVEKALPKGLIYQINKGCARKEYNVKVYRNEPIKIATKDGKLIFTSNLQVNAKGSYCAGVWQDDWLCNCCCLGHRQRGRANPNVKLTIEVDLKLNPDYSIVANTKVDGEIISGKHVVIWILGFKISIPVEDVVGPIRNKLKPIKKQLDKQITSEINKINLKSEMQEIWDNAHKSIPVDDFFLHIYPENIFFQNFKSSGNTINLGVGVGTKLNLKSTQEQIPLKPLPDLKLVENSDGFFYINLPSDAHFDKVSNELNKAFKDKKYEYGSNWVKIKNITAYGIKINENASGILFDLDIKGKVSRFKRVKGHIYFTAKPALDIDKEIVYLDDFKMNSNTNSEIINNGLEFLINKFYYDDISKSTVYNYKNDLTKLENQIKKDLSEIKIEDYKVKLNLDEININGLYISEDVLGIDSDAKGKIETVRLRE